MLAGVHALVSAKYLAVSREQRQQVGQPAILKDEGSLKELMAQGNFAEIWQLDLESGRLQTALLLADTPWQDSNLISINKNFDQGRWIVELERTMGDNEIGLSILPGRRYTIGLALNGAGNPGGKHWVSLPITLSFGGNDTDFTAE